MASYKKGDEVEYRPIGGAADNVSHSTGTITEVVQAEGEYKYTIHNDNTGKSTTYQDMNIVGVIRAAAGHHEPSTKKAAHQASTAHSKASETVSTTSSSVGYKKGDTVEYRPIGGAADTVSHSTGTITDIVEEDGETKYTIRNDSTGKETTYQEMNIVGKAA
ncbi:uncharacterized protein STEHIDRAFT_107848 [Stereum hirsutum FP-91666 SS1]|uniref:uncharacterized protein n=1 Tax=Stereum hirsutum (strain FP-91666) TaxID=721885 RepID=UPI000440B14C|nr:uncharacterized protein STEHIDRAFT_107848 [Stereum hirsutum FP-91666 SS1]EIM91254.1 hypothetical protein STEHIDRAFT_107848 [Stereum hirsutum FP-91666 SS1]